MPDLSSAVTRLRSATSTVLGRSRKITGGQMDEDLMLYERLTPQNLKNLEKQYGQGAVIRYVKAMSAKKVKQNAP